MPSVWIKTRATASDAKRYRVEYRLGGRSAKVNYGGSFKTRREATIRAGAVGTDLAALRVPELTLTATAPATPTFKQAADAWRESRIDATDGTRVMHRVALGRALPMLGNVPISELEPQHFVDLITTLRAGGAKRSTISKTLIYSRAVLDELDLDPNPARDRRVRLPYEESEEIEPPEAEHVEAVYHALARAYRIPLLWLDWSGARVASIDNLRVDDYDQPRQRIRLRAATMKNKRGLWVDLPPVLADALDASLPPRDDRDPRAPLFPGTSADRLRTAIARACRACGLPEFSPHDLRHRRISVLHRQGRSWAEIAGMVGQRKLSITADTYTHVLVDGREVDYADLLG